MFETSVEKIFDIEARRDIRIVGLPVYRILKLKNNDHGLTASNPMFRISDSITLDVNSSEPPSSYERLRLLSISRRPQPRLEQIRLKFDRLTLSLARPGRLSTNPLFRRHLRTKGEVMNQSYLTSCTRLFGFPCFVWTFLCLTAVGISDRASLLAESGSPLRTGLWVTQRVPENTTEMTEFESMVRTNPHLSGVCLHIGWKELEKESGHLDFSAIEKTVAVLRRIGRKYELSIKPGADTPPFIYEEGGQSFATQVTNPHRPNFGQTVAIPVPWDPIYQRHFSHVIQQVGERYAADPLCVSVVLTCANFMSTEMHLPKSPEDRAKWNAMGDCETKLLEVYKKYTDEWAKAFPKQAISLHLSQVLDLPSRFFERIIDYGVNKYPERFTIQNCQLTGRKEDTGLQSYDLIQKYQDRAHHGFQSLAAFSHSGERMGSMQMAVLNMVHAKGEYWELWHGDGLNIEISAAVDKAWQEAKQLGYDAYKKKLIGEGSYRQRSDDHYRANARRVRN